MKQISISDFRTLLKAAYILTEVQDIEDEQSIVIAFDFWMYIDSCRKQYKFLRNVTQSVP